MACHVGIFPEGGQISFYNESNHNTTHLNIKPVKYHDTQKIREMFEEIKLKIKNNIGYACICLDQNCRNTIRKQFIEEGLSCGFKNVGIIYWEIAFYLDAMSPINYQPLNNDVIWIYSRYLIYVWKIDDSIVKYVGHWGPWWEDAKLTKNCLKTIVNETKLKKRPAVVLYGKDKAVFKEISDSIFLSPFNANSFFHSEGALLKAKQSGSKNEFINYLSLKIVIKIGDKEIKCFEAGQKLPIVYSQKLVKQSNTDELKIILGREDAKCFSLLSYQNAMLTFQMDTNEIYSVKITEHTMHSNHERRHLEKMVATKVNEDRFGMLFIGEKPLLNNPTSFYTTSPTKLYVITKIGISSNIKSDAIGIDLGTSRCCVAVNRRNGIATIPLDNTGERLLPSYIGYDEKHVKCGKTVVDRMRNYSKSSIFDSKRIIGRAFKNIEIDESWPFGIIERNGKVLLEIQKFDGNGYVSAVEAAAALLKHIKHKAEEIQGKKLSKAVITVPTAFTEVQKDATIKAAKLADWEEVVLLLEPVAAAFAYLIDRPIPKNSDVLLFDLGGGTLDVCIFKIQYDKILILSNTGDTKIGGRDFDRILINYFKNILITRYNVTLQEDKKHLLMAKCQTIKETLSVVSKSGLDIDDFDPSQSGVITITRDEYQKMCKSLLNSIKNTLNAALYTSRQIILIKFFMLEVEVECQ